jgi:error-prone DNA polymerase
VDYAELHCHSHFSFKEGASPVGSLLACAMELGYKALALTDHDNLSGAMRFARSARALGVKGIIGCELTLKGGYHLTVLVETLQGHSNLCQLLSLSHVLADERTEPQLDLRLLAEHSQGLTVLSGCKKGLVPSLLEEGDTSGAYDAARRCMEWFGKENFYLELQRNLVKGDILRNRQLAALAKQMELGVVATNNAHYHVREYSQLHDCLVAIKHNKTLEETHRERRANSEFYLKPPQKMAQLFKDCPEAIYNTVRIAEKCEFDLTRDLNYRFPDYTPPPGYTPATYLRKLCEEAAIRRYGPLTPRVVARLDEEFRLFDKHNLAGFLLHYYDIVQLARKVVIRLGLSDSEIPLEERPPGRGRGSSVAMLTGYLIGLSHIDPLQYDLSLERFLPDDLVSIALDIDLDFPRNIREELILAVHEEWGWERAALTGMYSTYQIKGAIRDLGKVLGLPFDQVDQLAKRVDHAHASNLGEEMAGLPEFKDKLDAPGWRDLVRLAKQLDGAPRYVAQHPGGMVIGSRPLTESVPVQKGAIDGRYILQWDKDDIDEARMVKIDFLALGALSQLQEALALIEKRTGKAIDISRIDFEDQQVYQMLWHADTVGIFQVESAAQMQTITRIRPRNLNDMAFEVACVRPGVGVHDGVRHFIHRRNGSEPVRYDHPLEKRALERTLGIVLYQDQMNQLAIDVGGLSPYEADQMRRAFARKYDNSAELAVFWEKFRNGAARKGVDEDTSWKIFNKFNGQYMFPEAHAVAFGVTAYQMAWLKRYYPIEFTTALFNQQPMGFWGLETIKEDVGRHGIQVLNPDVNLSDARCTIEGGAIRLGLMNVSNVGEATAERVLDERQAGGPFASLGDFMKRTGLLREEVESLTSTGAFDSLKDDRRAVLWETGLRYRATGKQLTLDLPVEQDIAPLKPLTEWETAMEEYRTLGLYPKGHLMALARPYLPKDVVDSIRLRAYEDGDLVKVAGLVARPLQHPLAEAYFVSLEDEFGFIPLIVWPSVYDEYKRALREPFMMVEGTVSRREGTMNIVVHKVTIPRVPGTSVAGNIKLPRPVFR